MKKVRNTLILVVVGVGVAIWQRSQVQRAIEPFPSPAPVAEADATSTPEPQAARVVLDTPPMPAPPGAGMPAATARLDADEARARFDRNPADHEAAMEMWRLTADTPAEEDVVMRAAVADPADELFVGLVQQIYYKSRNFQDGIRALSEIHRQPNGKTEAVESALGELLLEGDRPKEAVVVLKAAVEKKPSSVNFMMLAEAWNDLKEPRQALEAARRSVDAMTKEYAAVESPNPDGVDEIYRRTVLDSIVIGGLTATGQADEAERELALADARLVDWRRRKTPSVAAEKFLDRYGAELEKLRAELIRAH